MNRLVYVVAFASAVISAVPVFAADVEAKSQPPVDRGRVTELIGQLGADDYFVREKAQAELGAIGAEALDWLSEAAERARDVETAERLTYLLHTIHIDFVGPSDPEVVRGKLQNYSGMDDPLRRKTIDDLGALAPEVSSAALCRLVRFERSPELSKRAAVRILEQKSPEGADRAAAAARLKTAIGDSPRPAAEWVRTFLLEATDPATCATRLKKLTDDEEQVLRQFPHRTQPEIVISLLGRLASLYERLDRPQEVSAVMMRMAALEQEGDAHLRALLARFTDRREWKALDEALERFADRIQQDALLSYRAAHAFRLQSRSDRMQRYLEQARQVQPGEQVPHILVAQELQKQGFIDWAEEEMRSAIGMGEPTQVPTLYAQQHLAEWLHDRQADREAGEVLDAAVKGMEAAAAQQIDVSRVRTLEANRARAHYFHGLHYEAQKDRKKQLEHLLEGLADSPDDAEILIALFHVPDLDDSVRERVRKLIRESADGYRREIEQFRNVPIANDDERHDRATPYNQLAWLISNTEGDFREALAASQESLKITPDNPGHLDTLGRCYYALGDYENAVKFQTRAIELDPHAQQMQRQLKLFQKALADAKSKQTKSEPGASATGANEDVKPDEK